MSEWATGGAAARGLSEWRWQAEVTDSDGHSAGVTVSAGCLCRPPGRAAAYGHGHGVTSHGQCFAGRLSKWQ